MNSRSSSSSTSVFVCIYPLSQVGTFWSVNTKTCVCVKLPGMVLEELISNLNWEWNRERKKLGKIRGRSRENKKEEERYYREKQKLVKNKN